MFKILVLVMFTLVRSLEARIIPPSNKLIPAESKSVSMINEQEFLNLIKEMGQLYIERVPTDVSFSMRPEWKNPEVYAGATISGSPSSKFWTIAVTGGIARHKYMTLDGLALTICHEWGHLIGGTPIQNDFPFPRLGTFSVESQSDYFATLKCLRKLWEDKDNETIVGNMDVPETLKLNCKKSWQLAKDQALCIRMGMASLALSYVLADMDGDLKMPRFETPDPLIVSRTNDGYASNQCRLDTFFQGSLCEVSWANDLSYESDIDGTCHPRLGHKTGNRPLCWYHP